MCAKRHRYHNHPTLPFDEEEDFIFNVPGEDNRLNKRLTKGEKRISISEIDGSEEEDLGAETYSDSDIIFLSLGSGSSGNSYYVGSRKGGILVDAGVNAEFVVQKLADNGIHISMVKALLLTHDHSDHVRYAYTLLRNNRHIRLFCTNRVLNGLLRRHSISRRIKEYHNAIFKEIPFKVLDFEITAFEVPHDGTDNMGFSIEYYGRRFVLATDLGAITSRARHYISNANFLVIEANYDLRMLLEGRYPEYLKARIQTERGHLDNKVTAAFLKEIINPGLKYIFLCHLSQDNNTPAIALKEIREGLEQTGVKVGSAGETATDRKADVQLMALPRFEATRKFIFRESAGE